MNVAVAYDTVCLVTLDALEGPYACAEQSFREASYGPFLASIAAYAQEESNSSIGDNVTTAASMQPVAPQQPPSLDPSSPTPDGEQLTFFHGSVLPGFSLHFLASALVSNVPQYVNAVDCAAALGLLQRFTANWAAEASRRHHAHQATVTLHMMHRAWLGCLVVWLEANDHRKVNTGTADADETWATRLARACGVHHAELHRVVVATRQCVDEDDVQCALSDALELIAAGEFDIILQN